MGGVCSWGGAWSRGVCSQGVSAPGGVPGGDSPRTATAAGGAHTTGMHSCFVCLQRIFLERDVFFVLFVPLEKHV